MKDEFQIINKKTLYINPFKNKKRIKIYLSESKSSWITIEFLSEDFQNYFTLNSQMLFNLHPLQQGKVLMYNAGVESPRWHRSYLHQPEREPNKKRSYMYSGLKKIEDLRIPDPFQKLLTFLNEKEFEYKYNQVIANWYLNGKDYIAPHSDCQKEMMPNASIAIITLCEDEKYPRELRIISKNLKTIKSDTIYSQIKIKLKHGCIITMHGDTQTKFRHSIPKDFDNPTSRISLTFRKF
jgi:alkylated DNA repair dioxygenase AlkB